MDSRGEETVKHKHKVSHFYFYFCPKLEFRTYFVYFQTFPYKFKVQRTPTEFGLPVVWMEVVIFTFHGCCERKTCRNSNRTFCITLNRRSV